MYTGILILICLSIFHLFWQYNVSFIAFKREMLDEYLLMNSTMLTK